MANLPIATRVEDFSDEQIAKVVKSRSVSHPMTILPPFIGLGVAGLWFMFNTAAMAWLFLAAGGMLVLVGVGNVSLRIILLFDQVARQIKHDQRRALEEHAEAEIRDLETELAKLGATRASEQVVTLEQTFNVYQQQVIDKVGEDNNDFDNLAGTGEVMLVTGLQQLRKIKDLRRAQLMFNIKDAKQRIKVLKKDTSTDHSGEISSLGERVQAHADNEERINTLRTDVAGIINQLMMTTNSLSDYAGSREEMEHTVRSTVARFQEVTETSLELNRAITKSWQQIKGTDEPLTDIDFSDF